MIPIYIMTRNDARHLDKCVKSIMNTISIQYTIYIVDNKSNNEDHIKILYELSKLESVEVVYNNKNNWILGLNQELIKSDRYSKDYFFITDGDIDFSECKAPIEYDCWMSYLIAKMQDNCSLGKIGLSLDWDFLIKNDMDSILEQEMSLYNEQKKIDDLYVSAVDTTACLFRKNWSVEQSGLLYPDHMRYIKPELYSCRTPKNVCVEHLGWHGYKSKEQSTKHINEKVKCFTLIGGTLKEEVVSRADFKYQLFYKTFSKIIFKIWVVKRIFHYTSYFIKKVTRLFYGQDSKVNI